MIIKLKQPAHLGIIHVFVIVQHLDCCKSNLVKRDIIGNYDACTTMLDAVILLACSTLFVEMYFNLVLTNTNRVAVSARAHSQFLI